MTTLNWEISTLDGTPRLVSSANHDSDLSFAATVSQLATVPDGSWHGCVSLIASTTHTTLSEAMSWCEQITNRYSKTVSKLTDGGAGVEILRDGMRGLVRPWNEDEWSAEIRMPDHGELRGHLIKSSFKSSEEAVDWVDKQFTTQQASDGRDQ